MESCLPVQYTGGFDRMRWLDLDARRQRRVDYTLARYRCWSLWFAWHPVKIGHQWFWLELLERRATPFWFGERVWWEYRYAAPQERGSSSTD